MCVCVCVCVRVCVCVFMCDAEEFHMNLYYWFVHNLVYNKHLLFNMHGINIKLISASCLVYVV
jgi:hypothetical protein